LVFCRDERIVSRAIELNEQLQKVLARHDDLLAGRVTTTTATRFDHEEGEEEEEPEQLVRRCIPLEFNLVHFCNVGWCWIFKILYSGYGLIPCRLRKGKACARPEDEETETDIPPLGLLGERLNRPLIRPLSIEPQSRDAETRPPHVAILPSREAGTRSPPVVIPPPRPKQNGDVSHHVAIPPPPAKHVEREKYFQENKDGSNLSGHMRGLSLHSRNGSSSHSGSFDFSEWSLHNRVFIFSFHFCLHLELVLLKLWGIGDFSLSLGEYGDGREEKKRNHSASLYKLLVIMLSDYVPWPGVCEFQV